MKTRSKLTRQIVLAAFAAGLLGSTNAATIAVTSFADEVANDTNCTLREAIIAVNNGADSNGCIADVSANPYGTADTIILQAGTYQLSIPPESNAPVSIDANTWQVGEYTATYVPATTTTPATYAIKVTPNASVGDLDIMKSVILQGAGEDRTIIDGGWTPQYPVTEPITGTTVTDPGSATEGFGDRVFHIVTNQTTTVDVKISDLTVKGGRLGNLTGMQAPSPDTIDYSLRRGGGAIAVSVAAAAYDPTAASGGTEGGSGHRGGPGGAGGGEETGPTYNLTLSNVTLTGNYAGDGGGLYNTAVATVSGITVSGNYGFANGGGIYNDARMDMTNSTVSGNGAEGGGALFDTGSHTTTIIGSTLSDNAAVGGGGISSRARVTINMANDTVSGNYAKDMGGGINTNGTINLIHVTVVGNVTGIETTETSTTGSTSTEASMGGSGINTFANNAAVTLRGVLLAHNYKGTDPATHTGANCGATGGTFSVNSGSVGLGYNLDSDGTCLLTGFGEKANVDPQIGALANNGGRTKTIALLPGSPAINGDVPLTGLTVDQRGVARDSTPDIGSYEYPYGISLDGGSSSSCFIATAAYGSPMQLDVRYLRAFRDQYLLTNSIGRKLVAYYYRISPPMANYIRQHDGLRAAVRVGLKPAVWMAQLLVHTPAVPNQSAVQIHFRQPGTVPPIPRPAVPRSNEHSPTHVRR